MKLHFLLSFFFAFLALVRATTELEKSQFEIARKAYAEATGKDLRDEGERRIAFVEKWHNGKAAMDCAAGFTHYVLIVANTKKNGVGESAEWSLVHPTSVHMGKADPGKVANTPATIIVSNWATDKMRGNSYQWKGWVKDTATEEELKDKCKSETRRWICVLMLIVARTAKQYKRANPTYNLVTNNCIFFANSIYTEIQGMH